MNDCPNCKEHFDDHTKMCPACGEKLISQSAAEKEETSDEGEFVAIMTAIGLF